MEQFNHRERREPKEGQGGGQTGAIAWWVKTIPFLAFFALFVVGQLLLFSFRRFSL
jgi:hypothetical protein